MLFFDWSVLQIVVRICLVLSCLVHSNDRGTHLLDYHASNLCTNALPEIRNPLAPNPHSPLHPLLSASIHHFTESKNLEIKQLGNPGNICWVWPTKTPPLHQSPATMATWPSWHGFAKTKVTELHLEGCRMRVSYINIAWSRYCTAQHVYRNNSKHTVNVYNSVLYIQSVHLDSLHIHEVKHFIYVSGI